MDLTTPMEEEDDQRKYFESETPRFFKIILRDTLHNGKLGFPKSFIRKCGTCLCSHKVYLRVPSGDVWEVELHREEDGEMWLVNGWQDFAEFYNIKFSYFLVFGYQGNSEFQVLIFDDTASEIKYPCKSNISEQHNADGVGPCSLSVKPAIEESHAEMLVDHNASKINECDKNTDCTVYDYFHGELGTSKSFIPNECREKADAIIRSTAFDSPNPYFQIIMRPSYVNKNCLLHVPGRFIMNHIGQRDFHLKLSVPCGRFWIMKCRVRMRGNEYVTRIKQGWKPFVKDNNLVVGDVCVFELIDGVKVHFHVTIFRATADRTCIPYPVKSEPIASSGMQVFPQPPCHDVSSSNIQYATTSNCTSKNPSFDLVITEARVKSSKVPIVASFLKHLKPGAQMVALEVAGRLWHVKVCFYQRRPGKEGFFSAGWIKFARENSLRVGDVCIFELIEREEGVLKVSILKGST